MGLGTRILVGMLIGAVLGLVIGERAALVEPVGDLFISLLMMVAIPLVAANLLAGLTGLDDVRTFGRLATRVLGWFFATTAVALLVGLTAMLLLAPGEGMALTAAVDREVGAAPTVVEILIGLVPRNPFQSLADGNVTQVVVVCVLLGVAVLRLPDGPRLRLRELFADLAAAFRALVGLILIVAPLGIGALMAVTTGRYGAALVGPVALFVGGVWGAHVVMIVLYMLLLRTFTTWSPVRFLRETGAVWATTLATTSSLASLTVSLEVAEKMRLPRTLYSFALPLGAQINKDGTAILLIGVLLFTAQAAGVTLAPGELFTGLLMAFVLSVGSGGIPGGGFVVALILVQAFGLPLEIAAIVGGIYRLIDMGNTTVNVMGDLVGTALLARMDGGDTQSPVPASVGAAP